MIRLAGFFFLLSAGILLSGIWFFSFQEPEINPVSSVQKPAFSLQPRQKGESGLLLPRFVSIKKIPANLRKGPSQKYEIFWIFQKKHLPVEILAEFGNWRKIRDSSGAEGWIFHSLLSGQRYALVAPWKEEKPIPVYKEKTDLSQPIALLENNVLISVKNCDKIWCFISTDIQRHNRKRRISGWIQQSKIWGVYAGEVLP